MLQQKHEIFSSLKESGTVPPIADERVLVMNVYYKSTRGKESNVTASMAILKGLANDGGLFMPEVMPKLEISMKDLAKMTYQETAYEVMKLFLTDFTK